MRTIVLAFLVTIASILICRSAIGQEIVQRADGTKVRLNEDGSWDVIPVLPFETSQKSISAKDLLIEIKLRSAELDQNEIVGPVFKFSIVSLSPDKILKLRTHSTYYNEFTGDGGSYPYGFQVKDNFGNLFEVVSVSPKYEGYKDKGLRPGDTMEFEITLNDTPLSSTIFLSFTFDAGVFGNKNSITMKIPNEFLERKPRKTAMDEMLENDARIRELFKPRE
jgi:hypothetical protein